MGEKLDLEGLSFDQAIEKLDKTVAQRLREKPPTDATKKKELSSELYETAAQKAQQAAELIEGKKKQITQLCEEIIVDLQRLRRKRFFAGGELKFRSEMRLMQTVLSALQRSKQVELRLVQGNDSGVDVDKMVDDLVNRVVG